VEDESAAEEPTSQDSTPDDPEEWSDEEWIAWLDSTEGQRVEPLYPRPRRPKSAAGRLVGAAMLGLHEVFYGRRDEKQVQVAPAPGPPDDEDIEVELDPDDPSRSQVRFRDQE
jgi:hypothetical protein